MHHERLITGVAAAFAAIAIVLGLTSLVTNLAVFPVALVFAAAAYLMYDQLSGRMAARVYRRVERRARVDSGGQPRPDGRRQRGDGGRRRGDGRRTATGGFGAGPREQWVPPRGGQTAREAAGFGAAGRAAARQRRAARRNRPGPSPADRAAYETLGLDPGADDEAIRRAYRERVKDVHPDAPNGNMKRFTAVKEAYEHLIE